MRVVPNPTGRLPKARSLTACPTENKRESRRRHPRENGDGGCLLPLYMGLQGQVDAKFNGTIVAPPLRISAPSFPSYLSSFPPLSPAILALSPVIPAKAGIQTLAAKSAIRNQV